MNENIKSRGQISYGDMVQICMELGYKISNGERRLRKSESPNVEEIMGKSKRGTQYIVGYRWKPYFAPENENLVPMAVETREDMLTVLKPIVEMIRKENTATIAGKNYQIYKHVEKPAEKRQAVIKFKDLEIDTDKHEVTAAGKPVELTAKEFQLMFYLAQNQERVFSRERLLDSVWGIDVAIETRTVDVHMRRLREKLGKAGRHLITLRGVGYKFKE